MITLQNSLYQSCYCEENVYKLLEKLDKNTDFYAVLISNNSKQIPLWNQKAARNNSFVVWDYHVISIKKQPNGSQVYDLDTTLSFPQDFETYWKETFNTDLELNDQYKRHFRVIPASVYLSLLSSDRSHMQKEDGSWIKPPPEWPIINPGIPTNLMELIKMSNIFDQTHTFDEENMYNFFK